MVNSRRSDKHDATVYLMTKNARHLREQIQPIHVGVSFPRIEPFFRQSSSFVRTLIGRGAFTHPSTLPSIHVLVYFGSVHHLSHINPLVPTHRSHTPFWFRQIRRLHPRSTPFWFRQTHAQSMLPPVVFRLSARKHHHVNRYVSSLKRLAFL